MSITDEFIHVDLVDPDQFDVTRDSPYGRAKGRIRTAVSDRFEIQIATERTFVQVALGMRAADGQVATPLITVTKWDSGFPVRVELTGSDEGRLRHGSLDHFRDYLDLAHLAERYATQITDRVPVLTD